VGVREPSCFQRRHECSLHFAALHRFYDLCGSVIKLALEAAFEETEIGDSHDVDRDALRLVVLKVRARSILAQQNRKTAGVIGLGHVEPESLFEEVLVVRQPHEDIAIARIEIANRTVALEGGNPLKPEFKL